MVHLLHRLYGVDAAGSHQHVMWHFGDKSYQLLDAVKRAKFQADRSRDFGAPRGRKWPSNIDLACSP